MDVTATSVRKRKAGTMDPDGPAGGSGRADVIFRPVRPTALRLVVGYAAIAGTLPYLALKALWLSGSTIGITDPAFAEDPSMAVLNGLTAGMDAVAILLALTFTHSWGQRVRAWLPLFPIWVGTGLLAPIVVVAPLAAVASLFTPASTAGAADLPLAGWVRPMVYGSFTWQGLTLLTAFVLYSRVRWPSLFSTRYSERAGGRTRGLTAAGMLFAAFAGALHLAWAVGTDSGLVSVLVEGTWTAIAFGAIAAGTLLVRPRGHAFWVPVALLWTTAASLFSWGAWGALNNLAQTALVAEDVDVLQAAGSLAQVAGGALLAVALLGVVRRVLAGASPH